MGSKQSTTGQSTTGQSTTEQSTTSEGERITKQGFTGFTRRDLLFKVLLGTAAMMTSGCIMNDAPVRQVERKRKNIDFLASQTHETALDYEIIPRNPFEKGNGFRTYSVQGNLGLRTPLPYQEGWILHYKNLRGLLENPVKNLSMEDLDPMFGMFAEGVHPVNLAPKHYHLGIDIFRRVGFPIVAVHDGFVEKKENTNQGRCVRIAHPIKTLDGYHVETRYCHLDDYSDSVKEKQEGDKVHSGEVIGFLGGSGEVHGYFPHLHFEARMINVERGSPAIILNPSMIYFDSESPNLTSEIRGDVVEGLTKLVKDLPISEKKVLHMYAEYWKSAARKEHGEEYERLIEKIS